MDSIAIGGATESPLASALVCLDVRQYNLLHSPSTISPNLIHNCLVRCFVFSSDAFEVSPVFNR